MWRLPLSRRFRHPSEPTCKAGARPAVRIRESIVAATALVCLAGSLAGCGGGLNNELPSAGFPSTVQASADQTTAGTPATVSSSASQPVVTNALGATKDKPGKGATSTGGSSVAKTAAQLTASATPGSTAYKIGALDVLELTVFKVAELSKTVQVADSGTANFPLVGDIQAVGRTAQQVEREVAAKLGAKYLQNPQVTVFVKEYNSQRITIEGAVKKPGVHPIRGQGTLMQYIAMAEGLDASVAGTEVVVFRQIDGKRVAARFDIGEIRAGSTADPPLQSGDVVVVSSSAMKETFNNFVKVLPLMGVFATVL